MEGCVQAAGRGCRGTGSTRTTHPFVVRRQQASSHLRTFGADGLLSVIFLAGRPPGEFVVAHLHSAVSEPYSFDTRVGSTGYIESVAKIDHAFALKRVSALLVSQRPP